MFFAHHTAHFQVATDVVAFEDLGHLEVDLRRAAQPGARTEQPLAKRRELLARGGDILAPPRLLAQCQESAPHPDHGPDFCGGK